MAIIDLCVSTGRELSVAEVLIKQLKPDLYDLDLPDERFRHYSGK
jgi:hypothetical protein